MHKPKISSRQMLCLPIWIAFKAWYQPQTKQNGDYLFTSRNMTGPLRRRNIIYEHRREECKRTDMSQDLSCDLLTFSLPVPHQVRPWSHSLLYRTHNSELATVPLIGVIPAVVLSVARQCRVNAAPCRKNVKLFLLLWSNYVDIIYVNIPLTVITLEVVPAVDRLYPALCGWIALPLLCQLGAAVGSTELSRPLDRPGPKLCQWHENEAGDHSGYIILDFKFPPL